ncbi:MAG: FAD-dependent thymidylate synthase [Epsilonproteobacteria bacterium]|nr:FAD-dependent thymidylate synthase [Campylobacterota bacterium]
MSEVKLISFSPEPETLVTKAADICYEKQLDFETAAPKPKLINMVMKMGHLSILEHVSFTFLVTGLSRAASHQLVRHRIASYSQRSQRYVDETNFRYVMPESISKNPAAADKFKNLLSQIAELYKEFVSSDIPKEDARYILPNAAATSIIVTMNARELIHFITLRTCLRAQWEIRQIAEKMLVLAQNKAETIFDNAGPVCVKGPCTEGKFTCGKIEQVRNRYMNRKE